jgi:hypothetical protein
VVEDKCFLVMSCTVLAYSFGYSFLEYCVFTHDHFSSSSNSFSCLICWCTRSMYAALVSLVYLIVGGRSLVIEIRGRLIS